MRRLLVTAVVLAGVLAGCGDGDRAASDGPQTRKVLVDYSFDEFPASYYGYYPRVVEAHPGDTIDFRQSWTGDPHTVTLGTLAQKLLPQMGPLLKTPKEELPEFVDTEALGLPSIFSHITGDNTINQTAAQPCYIASGDLPLDGVGCPKQQPEFDGTQAFYNSGYIPYRGVRGNRFAVKLASTIEPGEYFYYCLLHGPGMGGFIDVKPRTEKVRTFPADMRDRDLKATTGVLRAALELSKKPSARLPGTDIQAGTFSHYATGGSPYPASVNAFEPETFRASVGEKVTWSFTNGPGHTVSFDVPPYFPVIEFKSTGVVRLNPDALSAVGGEGYPSDAEEAPEEGFAVDGGSYDGEGFRSSGYNDGPMRYSLTFTKPGTYPYACTIHPRMIGKVVVS
ncbi:MAG: hypothetical protein QOI61_2361 [Actinomycetota bacterium]|jgi:plastocyanin